MGAPVRVGDVLAEKYRITRILGTGGMGVVVAAWHCELDKLVALKFMHDELSSSKQITERFLREARAAARLENEHVVRVGDFGRLRNGVPYIVMEYLEGQDLGQLLEHDGPLDVADAVEYVLQACEAMAEAHARGVIHRDLKPQNLFLTTRQDGRRFVKVLDFGISKAQLSRGPTFTAQMVGSPSYMAPEQIRSSRTVDARADIWSLGVILYQLLSNTLPFVGDTVPEVIFQVLSRPAPPFASIRSGIPAGLLNAIDRCLEKDRENRFANVAELTHELVPFTPERARAAIALIERVMTAGVQQPRPSLPDAEFAAVIPSGEATTVSMRQPPGASTTTLGTAASSISVGDRTSPSRWRWLVIAATGIAAILVVTVIATPRSALPPPTVSPASAAVVSAEVHVPPDAAIDGPPDAPIDVVPDAATDALPDVGSTAPVPPRRPPTKPRKQVLESARTNDVPGPPTR